MVPVTAQSKHKYLNVDINTYTMKTKGDLINQTTTKKSQDTFKSLLKAMPKYLSALTLVERIDISDLNMKRGVYVFYERNKPLYTGKTDDLGRRLKEHANEGSKDNDANFAFLIAREEWKRLYKHLDKTKITRKALCLTTEFVPLFTDAKKRVHNMKIKYVVIEDPYEQYLFELYAAVKLNSKYNSFKNS